MTDKNEHFIDLSPINSSKSSHSDSFFSPHDPILFSFPKPEQTRLSLNEKPSVLLKSTYDASEPKIGFNPAFRVNFLRDLEKKGYSINKSKLSMNGRSENSTFLPLETPGKKKSSGEEREKEQV